MDHLPGRPDVRVAFSTRADGTVSTTVGQGDVGAARAAVLARVGVDPDAVVFMRQMHGSDVAVVSPADAAADVGPPVDAVMTTATELALAVMVADCVPLLMACGDAVAAVHAGRRGVQQGVVGVSVARLRGLAAASAASSAPAGPVRPEGAAPDVVAVIGPSIGGCCYEVPAGMAAEVDRVVPGAATTTTWGTPALNLPGAVATQLRASGVSTILRHGGCTLCEAATWFSHRAATGPAGMPHGRQAGVIVRRAGPASAAENAA